MNKILKTTILTLTYILLLTNFTFATNINLSANKTDLTTDDTVQISFSIDGEIDGNKLAISGLENFDIVGRSRSQSISIINGNSKTIQEQILILKPIKTGNIEISISAEENGKKITSKKLLLNIKKSLTQKTKDMLLDNTLANEENNKKKKKEENINKKNQNLNHLLTSNNINNNTQTDNNPLEISKDLLKKPQDIPDKKTEILSIKHISIFNFNFWIQLLTISILFVILIILIKKFLLKK